MPRTDLDVRLQARITEFVEEINALVREAAVEAVQEALTEGASKRGRKKAARQAPGKAAKRKAGKRKTGKRVRRTGAQVDALATKALAAIKREPGRRLGEIAKELRSTAKDIRRPVQTLLDDKKVRTTGQRGGTRYFPAGGGGRTKAAKKRAKTAKRKTTKRKSTKRGRTKAAG